MPDNISPRSDLIRPIGQGDQVTIPGPPQPAWLQRGPGKSPSFNGPMKAIEIVKGHGRNLNGLDSSAKSAILIGDRACSVGDVIAVSDVPRDDQGRQIRMGLDYPGLIEIKAKRLVESGYAQWTSKAPTVTLGASLAKPDFGIENTAERHERAERAVSPRQQKVGAL